MLFVGKCASCKARYSYEETAKGASKSYMPNRPYCSCRATVECTKWNCVSDKAHFHTATAIKFTPVKATLSTKECSAVCTNAVSPLCVCSCGGRNHGADNRIGAS